MSYPGSLLAHRDAYMQEHFTTEQPCATEHLALAEDREV